jgi:hypothetical protein
MSRKPSATNSTTRNRRNPRSVRGGGPKPLSRNQRRLRSRVRRLQTSARAPQPVVLEPVVEQPVVEEPVVEEPVVEEPVVEEPVVEEPVVEEPVVEEPVVEEPVVEEPRSLPNRGPVTATSPAPPRRRSPSLVTVGVTFVVLVLMTAVAALGVRLVRQGTSDSGSLSSAKGPAAPVQLRAGSAYVRSTVLADGRIRVTHWIHPRKFVSEIRLHLPSVRGLASGALSVSDLVAVADGHRVYAPPSIAGDDATLYVPGAHRIVLRYVLGGAVERTEPPAGRALARVVAVDVRDGHSTTRRTTAVTGPRVLSLACTAPRRDALPLPCGTADGTGWSVDGAAGPQLSRGQR